MAEAGHTRRPSSIRTERQVPETVGAATRLEGLTHASVHLLRLERALRRVASEDEAPAVGEALAGLRAVLRTLAADDATSPSCELAEGTAA
jgi:hypothetical protein